MAMARSSLCFTALFTLGIMMSGVAAAEDEALPAPEDLAPYKMLRSMQFVQDSVVAGDHSAAEMQKFMLATIDKRLRTADPEIFDDTRNVDAALIYSMSGGNPATLEYLVSRDVGGYFDNRVADALRKYLSGKGTLVSKSLVEMLPEYRDTTLGPYLALVSANAVVGNNPEEALKFYDLARLTAPGTIIEEAALRRSVAVTAERGMVEKGLGYANRYARRFLHSPYASQFADLFVMLAVDNYESIKNEDIENTLSFMDNERRREVYLRIARRAAIAGKIDLARMASAHADAIPTSPGMDRKQQTDLYTGLAEISTKDIDQAVENIDGIPEGTLSPRDEALRSAARLVAEEVLRQPDMNSLTQETSANVENQEHSTANLPAQGHSGAAAQADANEAVYRSGAVFEEFVTNSRAKLVEIDGLLAKESDKK